MADVLNCAKTADEGSEQVDSIWVPESWGRESFSTLGAIAQITNKVRLGTSIISIFARTPATVAMGATTLDMLSNKRAVIGLGSSTEAIVEGWHGAPFEQPVARMREYVECLRLMMSGEKASYTGKFYNLKNFKLLHQPPRPHVPLFVAAVNKRMVSLATELADGVLLYMRPLEELEHTIANIKNATVERKFEVALSLICAVSDGEPGKAREKAAKTLAFYVAAGKYYARFLADNGFQDEVERISKAYWASGGDVAAKQVPERMLNSLTIAGTRRECKKALASFVDTGVTLPILQLNPLEGAESSFREMLSTF